MDQWLLLGIFLVLVLGAPFAVFICNLIRRLEDFPSGTTIGITVATICMTIWVLAVVPLLIFSPLVSNEFRGMCLHLGLIAAVVAELLFVTLYANVGLSRSTTGLARLVALTTSALLAILLVAFVDGGIETTRVVGGSSNMRPSHDPLTLAFSSFSNILLAALLVMFYIDYGRLPASVVTKEEIRLNRWSLFLLATGSAITSFDNALSSLLETPPDYVLGVIYLIGRIPVSIGFALLAIHLTSSPLLLANGKGNTRSLLRKGTVGWLLAVMRTIGPTTASVNPSFNERNNISSTDIMTFCTASVTAVGMGESFRNASFIIPFPYHETLVSVCVSFLHRDPHVGDPRLEERSLCVFSLIVPSFLLSNVGDIRRAHAIVMEFANRASTVAHLAETETIATMSQRVLDSLI